MAASCIFVTERVFYDIAAADAYLRAEHDRPRAAGTFGYRSVTLLDARVNSENSKANNRNQ
jgi:hypothetical protein